MANNTKKKNVKLVTPCGVLKFPKLTKADYGTDKYPQPDGSYNTQFILTLDDAGVKEFLERLDALMERAKVEAEGILADMPIKSRKDIENKGGLVANKPYSIIYDEETEEPTGEVELRLRKRASFKNKDGSTSLSTPPPLFDSAQPPKLLPKSIEVWGGTQAKINLDVTPYFMNTGAYGLALRLNAVQIIKLVDSGGARDAASYGFEGTDDGWNSSSLEGQGSAPLDETPAHDGGDDEADF